MKNNQNIIIVILRQIFPQLFINNYCYIKKKLPYILIFKHAYND